MEHVIAGLLKDFEAGKMNRRQLIQSLALAAVAAAAPGQAIASTLNAQEKPSFKAVSVDHVSYQVADYAKSRDFYVGLLGMTVSDDDGRSQCYLHFGDHGSFLLPRNRRAPRAAAAGAATGATGTAPTTPAADTRPPVGLVDHISYKIDDWDTDKVQAELERRGIKPYGGTRFTPDTGGANGPKNYASFHVTDPDGFNLQISGDLKPGDRLYKKS